jgi:hydroxymethylpyrimidine/phosphomethylpyrimidine kinase
MRTPLSNIKDAPSCFCSKYELCKKHTTYEPNIEEMILLVEAQISEINKDESSVENSLEFIYSTLESILLTRRDTFKEQLTRYYKEKDTEVKQLRQRIKSIESSRLS